MSQAEELHHDLGVGDLLQLAELLQPLHVLGQRLVVVDDRHGDLVLELEAAQPFHIEHDPVYHGAGQSGVDALQLGPLAGVRVGSPGNPGKHQEE